LGSPASGDSIVIWKIITVENLSVSIQLGSPASGDLA